jgi:predicted transcriptional regulator
MAEPDRVPNINSGQTLYRTPSSDQSQRTTIALARGLGQREREVMSVLWEQGGASVLDVSKRLSTTLAYTTVMTTLDRLFKKGLLRREKKVRAFIYSTLLTRKEVEGERAANLIRRYFSDSGAQPDLLISCLVDAVHHYDKALLDELEARIRGARARSHASGAESGEGS